MRRIGKAILFASFYLIVFTVLPSLSLWLLPPEIQGFVPLIKEYTNLDVQFIIIVTMIIGIFLATLSFLRNIVNEQSVVNLTIGLLIEAIGIFLSLFLLGLGNPVCLGLIEININYSSGGTVLLDLQLIAILTLAISVFNALKSVVNFYYARKEDQE